MDNIRASVEMEVSTLPNLTVGDVYVETPRMTTRNVNVFYGDKLAIDDVTLDIGESRSFPSSALPAAENRLSYAV